MNNKIDLSIQKKRYLVEMPTIEQLEETIKRRAAHCPHKWHGQKLCCGCAASAVMKELERTREDRSTNEMIIVPTKKECDELWTKITENIDHIDFSWTGEIRDDLFRAWYADVKGERE